MLAILFFLFLSKLISTVGAKATKDFNNINTLEGSELQKQCKIEETISCYDKALKISPNNNSLLIDKVPALQKQYKLDDVIAC